MIATRRKIYTDKLLDNLLDAQKNMASAEKVDAKGLVYLSRFILRLLKQLDDEVIELCAEAEDERGQNPVDKLKYLDCNLVAGDPQVFAQFTRKKEKQLNPVQWRKTLQQAHPKIPFCLNKAVHHMADRVLPFVCHVVKNRCTCSHNLPISDRFAERNHRR